MIIRTDKITQSFRVADGDFYALRDVSIEIPENKLTILRGRSGSGKTTLMNILGALDLPKSGSVYLGDVDITKMSESERDLLRKTRFGFVFQSVALIPIMNAYENVEFVLRLAGYQENKDERVRECLSLVGLGKRMKHMPQELSGGEQQRVAIARAMAHKPDIIFADEPTAELDSATGIQVIKMFKKLVEKENVTIVMSTHDTGFMEVADCIYELEDGKIVEQ